MPQDEASTNRIFRFFVEPVAQQTNTSSCDVITSTSSRFWSIRLNLPPNVFRHGFDCVVRHKCLCFEHPEVGRIVALDHRSCHSTPEPSFVLKHVSKSWKAFADFSPRRCIRAQDLANCCGNHGLICNQLRDSVRDLSAHVFAQRFPTSSTNTTRVHGNHTELRVVTFRIQMLCKRRKRIGDATPQCRDRCLQNKRCSERTSGSERD